MSSSRPRILCLGTIVCIILSPSSSFTSRQLIHPISLHKATTTNSPPGLNGRHVAQWSTTTAKENSQFAKITYNPIFDFADRQEQAVNKFERIDDAIMGGISLSSLKQLPDEDFARWSGICRLDGGGFCGTRTLPFKEPLQPGTNATGIYLVCRLTSDNEPERRVWKMTTRSEQSRGEQLYQAMFQLPTMTNPEESSWARVEIPFADFVQVRGPRMVQGAPPLDVSNGLYQIGISLSKFMISQNGTEIPNFRPGFFELQIQEIGVYQETKEIIDNSGDDNVVAAAAASVVRPSTLSRLEAEKKKPILLKMLLPLGKLLFSEKRRRRQSAMRILRQRGFSKLQTMLFGYKLRVKHSGFIRAATNLVSVVCQDFVRALLYWTLRLTVGLPFLLVSRAMTLVRGQRGKEGPLSKNGSSTTNG